MDRSLHTVKWFALLPYQYFSLVQLRIWFFIYEHISCIFSILQTFPGLPGKWCHNRWEKDPFSWDLNVGLMKMWKWAFNTLCKIFFPYTYTINAYSFLITARYETKRLHITKSLHHINVHINVHITCITLWLWLRLRFALMIKPLYVLPFNLIKHTPQFHGCSMQRKKCWFSTNS